MMHSFNAKNLTELQFIAKEIISKISYPILCFYGNLGSGKTTLIKEILNELKVIEPTSSPTYSIANQYKSTDGKIFYHFDFYRLKSESEAYEIGLEEYLDSKNYCFIEWPEKISSFLPNYFHKISINTDKNNRIITFE